MMRYRVSLYLNDIVERAVVSVDIETIADVQYSMHVDMTTQCTNPAYCTHHSISKHATMSSSFLTYQHPESMMKYFRSYGGKVNLFV